MEAAEKGERPFPVGAIVMSTSNDDIKELWDNRNEKKCGVYSQSGAFMSDAVARKIVECNDEAARTSQYHGDFNLVIEFEINRTIQKIRRKILSSDLN